MHDLKNLGDRALEVQIRSVKKDLEKFGPDLNEDQQKQAETLTAYLAECEHELAVRNGTAERAPEKAPEAPPKKKRAPAKKKAEKPAEDAPPAPENTEPQA